MLVDRSGYSPVVARSARVAPTASVVGNVVIGDGCVVDYGAVITSSGPPVRLAEGVVVMANAVVRSVGDGCRLGAGSIVHTHATVLERTRVGLRHFAVPDATGDGVVITSDVTQARTHLAQADFFTQAFDLADDDLVELHRRSVELLRQEASGWDDLPPA